MNLEILIPIGLALIFVFIAYKIYKKNKVTKSDKVNIGIGDGGTLGGGNVDPRKDEVIPTKDERNY